MGDIEYYIKDKKDIQEMNVDCVFDRLQHKDSKDQKESREHKDNKENKDSKDSKEHKDIRINDENKENKDKEKTEHKESTDNKENTEHMENTEHIEKNTENKDSSKEHKESNVNKDNTEKEFKENKEIKESTDYKEEHNNDNKVEDNLKLVDIQKAKEKLEDEHRRIIIKNIFLMNNFETLYTELNSPLFRTEDIPILEKCGFAGFCIKYACLGIFGLNTGKFLKKSANNNFNFDINSINPLTNQVVNSW